jgi:hypothetical protein
MAVSHSFRHSRGLQSHRAAETLISIHVGHDYSPHSRDWQPGLLEQKKAIRPLPCSLIAPLDFLQRLRPPVLCSVSFSERERFTLRYLSHAIRPLGSSNSAAVMKACRRTCR